MKILLCANGTPHAAQALELGANIARKAATFVDILVVAERDHEEAHRLAAATAAELKAAQIPVTLYQRVGRIDEEAVRQVQVASYDLIVIGSRGRRGVLRLLMGSVALRVVEHAPAPVLVVKGRARELGRFLVCSSAGPMSERTVQFAGRLARSLGASVTLLHVMSQLPLTETAFLDDLEASAEELIQRGSREGLHLGRMLDLLAEEGQPGRAVVRHGLVRDEIVAEGQRGQYDLVVIGAHVTPGLNARIVDDLTAEILLAANRPVLVIY
jgi:nucleotide-binding universal stress UspA family protein